jgi:hypothetical protein
MYSKIGLGLLAAAGLTFGVVGMQAGGASPTATSCTDADAGVSAPSGGGSATAAGDQSDATGSGHDRGTGAEGNGGGLEGGNGNGNGDGSGEGSGDGHNGPATPPTTGGDGQPTTGPTVDDRFLVLHGNTDETDVGNGTATVPPSGSDVTGRSRILSHLLRIDGDLDTRR